MTVLAEPVGEELLCDFGCTAVFRPAPVAHVGTQLVDQREFVALFLGEETFLRRPDLLCLEPITRRPAPRRLARDATHVAPMTCRLLIGIVENRVWRCLCRRPFLRGFLRCGRMSSTGGHSFQACTARTAITSLPRGSMTFTATRLCLPAENGMDVVPLKASKASISAAEPSALAIFSQASWLGKKA